MIESVMSKQRIFEIISYHRMGNHVYGAEAAAPVLLQTQRRQPYHGPPPGRDGPKPRYYDAIGIRLGWTARPILILVGCPPRRCPESDRTAR